MNKKDLKTKIKKLLCSFFAWIAQRHGKAQELIERPDQGDDITRREY
jgi:hypothetical protein